VHTLEKKDGTEANATYCERFANKRLDKNVDSVGPTLSCDGADCDVEPVTPPCSKYVWRIKRAGNSKMMGTPRSHSDARPAKIIISDKDLISDPSVAIEILSDMEGSPLDETAYAVAHIPDIDTLISGTDPKMSADDIEESILDVGVSDTDIFSFMGDATHIHSEADIELGLGWNWGSPSRHSAFAVVPRNDYATKEVKVAPVSEEAVVPKQVTDSMSGDQCILPVLVSC